MNRIIAITAVFTVMITQWNLEADGGLVVTLEQTAGDSGPVAAISAPISILGNGNEAASFNNAYGDFFLQSLTVFSNANQATSMSMLQDISISIQNGTASAATLVITVFDDSFTTPGNPGDVLPLINRLSSSFVSGGSVTFVSSLDGQSTAPVTFNGSGLDSTQIFATRGPGTEFTLGNQLTITLAAGGQANVTGTTLISPAPSASTLFLTCLPLLGFVFLRTRKTVAALE